VKLKSLLNYKQAPMRRWTDRIRVLADDLWELGRKKEAEEMQVYAARKEAQRKEENKSVRWRRGGILGRRRD